MSQRDSGYARKADDLYETPGWVTAALLPELPRESQIIWEPAAGSGKIVSVLRMLTDASVIATDIETDFLKAELPFGCDCIVTNPPYGLAVDFIERGLSLLKPYGVLALLLRTDFDHAKTRSHLFARCPAFAKKLVLTRRIRWFRDTTGSPSFNHAWFVWDWQHKGPPTLAYGPCTP